MPVKTRTKRKTKIDLQVPSDIKLLRAMGRVTAAHANLELVLKMCVKTLARLTVEEAMLAFDRTNTSEVRGWIRRLFRQACKDEQLRCTLQAMLGEAKQIAEDRNRLIHRPWGGSGKGDLLTPNERWVWGKVPTPDELNQLAERINDLANRLNHERLRGFISDVVGN